MGGSAGVVLWNVYTYSEFGVKPDDAIDGKFGFCVYAEFVSKACTFEDAALISFYFGRAPQSRLGGPF